jgi:dynein heavy chain
MPPAAAALQVHAMQQVEVVEIPSEGPVPLAEFMALQDDVRK